MQLLLAAVRSYLDDFGHEEADLLRRVKQLLAKLQAPAIEPPEARRPPCARRAVTPGESPRSAGFHRMRNVRAVPCTLENVGRHPLRSSRCEACSTCTE